MANNIASSRDLENLAEGLDFLNTRDPEIMTIDAPQASPKEEDTPIVNKKRFLGEIIDGKLNGTMEYYDDDNNLISEQNFEKGLLHGELRTYDIFHHLTKKITYHEGKLQGPAELYRNQTLLMSTHFVEGKQEGETLLYDEGDVIQTRLHFAKGLKHGPMISYDPLERVQKILHYENDLLEGPMVSYYPSGALLLSGHYVQGKSHGEFCTYYETGVVKQIIVYDHGRMLGPPQQYDMNGYPTVRGA